ncbi:MAG: 1-acyl-sn-glycerol-3-phosphate acyltransferase [Candidatus Omnitrophica bacterium]|nr:1-acyl-sn-glycerol-3-phosphate acyltransferase [Candidatus Omnitrophota bacterium]
MIYSAAYVLMKLFDAIYFRTKFKGLENIPSAQAYILACNHKSNLDPFIVGICKRQRFSFLAKEELFKSKIADFLFRGMGAFPIKRDTSDFGALREALRRLKKGPLILFPEGTRGVGDRKKEPQPGVGFLAKKSGVPVIPVFIEGSDKGFPSGAKWFRFYPIKITFGPPIVFNDQQDYHQIADTILEAIYSQSK